MTQSTRGPRNGMAKLLSEADPDASLAEIADVKDRFECPACGWGADLHRNECMVCDYSQPLRRVQFEDGGG